jgi:nitrite reductase/ring-hydroxylating ferredoxin subunit
MYINFWYPICTTEELNEQNPRRAELLGVRLAAFRDESGAAHVLADTCVHRGGSLSKGKVIGPTTAGNTAVTASAQKFRPSVAKHHRHAPRSTVTRCRKSTA